MNKEQKKNEFRACCGWLWEPSFGYKYIFLFSTSISTVSFFIPPLCFIAIAIRKKLSAELFATREISVFLMDEGRNSLWQVLHSCWHRKKIVSDEASLIQLEDELFIIMARARVALTKKTVQAWARNYDAMFKSLDDSREFKIKIYANLKAIFVLSSMSIKFCIFINSLVLKNFWYYISGKFVKAFGFYGILNYSNNLCFRSNLPTFLSFQGKFCIETCIQEYDIFNLKNIDTRVRILQQFDILYSRYSLQSQEENFLSVKKAQNSLFNHIRRFFEVFIAQKKK